MISGTLAMTFGSALTNAVKLRGTVPTYLRIDIFFL